MLRRFAALFLLATAPLAVVSLSAHCPALVRMALVPLASDTNSRTTTASFLPSPPEQDTPWATPSGKDAAWAPSSLLTATETLFAQGLPDPRGCEYRTITVPVGSIGGEDETTLETHGWVLPASPGEQRFAVCWNGLIYPVIAVKDRASLHEDVQQLVTKHQERFSQSRRFAGQRPYSFGFTGETTSLSVDYPLLFKVIYLIRLGENDLARSLYRLWEPETPPQNNDNAINRDPYLSLASQWAWSAYDRAVYAHIRGAHRIAVADTDLLTRIQPSIEAEAAKRGYKPYPDSTPYLYFLYNLSALQREAVRHAAETPRPPLNRRALQTKPQNERIAELILRLEEVTRRMDGHPVTEALIAEGDTAIEPLLDVIENDDRLTRSVVRRGVHQHIGPAPVKSVAFACFARITGVTEIGYGNPSPTALREWWAKNKAFSPAERWFNQLADVGAAPCPSPSSIAPLASQDSHLHKELERKLHNRRRWEEAASQILERSGIQRRGALVSVSRYDPTKSLPPFKGESLRGRQNPSVSDLLRMRARQLFAPAEIHLHSDYESGADFALMLYEWEPNGHDTLPTLQEAMWQCIDFQSSQQSQDRPSLNKYELNRRIADLAFARILSGDSMAAAEFALWLSAVSSRQ